MIIRRLSVTAGICLLGVSTAVSAFIFEPGAGLGWQYSDNVALTPDDEEADWGAVAYLGGSLIEDGGPLTYNAAGTLTYQRYANKTFDDTTYFNLNARVNWAQVDSYLTMIRVGEGVIALQDWADEQKAKLELVVRTAEAVWG